MKRLALLLIPFAAVLLMSHNVSAAGRVGHYTYGASNVSGLPNTIVNNRQYNVTASQSDFFIANGQWTSGVYWMPGQEYHLSLTVVLEGSNITSVVPEAINVQESHYTSTGDVITSSVSCPNTTICKWTVIHDITIVGLLEGTEVIKTPNSNILNAHTSGSFSGTFVMAAMFFQDTDEWRAWRDSVENDISDISSNTSDTVDILDQIYDRLGELDSNAEKNAQGWANMQDTDGLVDIGDDSQLLSIVGTISTVFDSIKNAPMAESCTVAGFDTPVDIGDVNLCYPLPQWVRDLGGFVMTTITFVAVLFMLIGCVNAVNKFMDWARHN